MPDSRPKDPLPTARASTDWLTIGQLATRTGVAASALRYYETQGLISSERTSAGYRQYRRATTRRVAFIVFAQRVGLSLDEVATELAKLPDDRIPHRADWAKLSTGWTRRLDERIAELQRLKLSLSECIGCGCLSLKRCRLANARDRAARLGAGPRFWLGDSPRPPADEA